MSEEKKKSGFSGFIDRLKKLKKAELLLVIGLCVVAVIILAITFIPNDTSEENNSAIDSYVADLESRLSNTLSKVSGAGKVSVVITVESGMESVLAMKTTVTENSGVKETVETPIMVNGKPVVLKEMYPKVIGVLIVAEGADSIAVLYKLQTATVSLLDINIDQIEILSMN